MSGTGDPDGSFFYETLGHVAWVDQTNPPPKLIVPEKKKFSERQNSSLKTTSSLI
jgi:hypothetical protein